MPRPPTSTSSYPTSTPYPTQTPPYPPYSQYPGYPPTSASQPPGYPPAGAYPGSGNYPRYPGQPPYPPVSTAATNGASNTGTITAEHIRSSLVSAVEDRLKAKEREMVEQKRAEINVLRKTADDLEKGKRRLEEIMSKMESEAVELAETKHQLREKDNQLKELLLKHEDSDKQVAIDDAFGPTEPLYKQYVATYCLAVTCADRPCLFDR